ncbi:GPW/gp25 family protein [Agrobacterium tumefaciens]
MALDPSIDIDAVSGVDIVAWPHVLQSIQQILTTRFGERVMREWFGSAVPNLLGENLTTKTVVAFFSAVSSAIEQWEPRFRVIRIIPESVGRDGRLQVQIEGEYRPRALLGDFTPEGARRVTIAANDNGLKLEAA